MVKANAINGCAGFTLLVTHPARRVTPKVCASLRGFRRHMSNNRLRCEDMDESGSANEGKMRTDLTFIITYVGRVNEVNQRL